MLKIILVIVVTILIILFISFLIIFKYIEKILEYGYISHHQINSFYNKDYYNKLISYTKEDPFTIVGMYNKKEANGMIVYSLYGNNKKRYFKYIKNNIKLQRKHFPDWKTRIYVHDQLNRDTMNELIQMGIELIIVKDKHIIPGNSAGAFWRLLSILEDTNLVISDIDDNLKWKLKLMKDFYSDRNKNMVYLEHKPFQPYNNFLAGRFMKKKGVVIPVKSELIIEYPVRSKYGQDEMFLAKEIYPHLKKYPIQRDEGNKFLRKFIDIVVKLKYGNENYLISETFKNFIEGFNF